MNYALLISKFSIVEKNMFRNGTGNSNFCISVSTYVVVKHRSTHSSTNTTRGLVRYLMYILILGIVSMILIRTLRRDIAKYNQEDEMDDTIEESGWKLVHGDVFRPPRFRLLLTACVGSGVQLFAMALITLGT